MRTIAGERRTQSLSLLLAAGVGNTRIAVGKYFGALGFVLLILVLVLAMPLALEFGTSLDLGRLAAAALGLALFAGALTAIGVLCSAWTSQPALAAAVRVRDHEPARDRRCRRARAGRRQRGHQLSGAADARRAVLSRTRRQRRHRAISC